MPPKAWWRQCLRSRAVSGVTRQPALRQRPPGGECLPQTVDQRGQFVLLIGRFKRLAVGVEVELQLGSASGLPWLRYRRNEGHATPAFADLVGGLAAFVEKPSAERALHRES